ncbi:helix-turn-helix domain-containing protein [Streptomyces sp. NBC_01317]|uniref:helix-turn-helix domain-containing protein n=1 Tax=Streptomyces sp. NBC_01317 TaxID=2903822 RepID=UPI002E120B0D|nr:helix-turn-helix domain-containing protein [Streptomyces sp. NBC_01317]
MSTPKDAETDAFARRLREIREGSGRSYGALARRVGVSGSTLHRYCSGSTVPVEFAPIERLARLCGCEADDLIALHRLWVRADIERRKRQEAGAGVAAGAGAGAGAGADKEMEGEVEVEGGSADTSEPLTVGPPPPDPPPPARRRLLRRTGCSAAVAAAVLALVLLVAFDRSPLSTADRPRAADRPAGGSTTGTTPSPGGGVTSGTSSSPGPRISGTATAPTGAPRSGDPKQTKNPRPGTTAGKKPSGPSSGTKGGGGSGNTGGGNDSGTPFTWSTNRYVWEGGCGHAFLVNRAPSAVPPPPTEADAEPWARSVGAVDAGESSVRVTVQGKSDTAVVLQALHVRIAAKRTPLPYRTYHMSPGCGGSLTPRLFDIDLDASRPLARSKAGNDAGEPIPAVSFPYRVSATDPEILLATGRAVTCDCAWYLELEWSSGARSGTVRIDDHGKPFRTSGLRGRPAYEYDTGSHRWIPAEPTLAADPAGITDTPQGSPEA